MRSVLLSFIVLGAFAAPAVADVSPYRGMERRAVKALSDQEIDGLKAGKGMSMALAGELNGFPGPRHVLDMAGPLGLSAGQVAAVQALFDTMQAEATALGAAVINKEGELEHGFRSATLDDQSLTATVMAIAELRGRLRATHLRYHLATRELLDPQQLALYDHLRGYEGHEAGHTHGH